MVGSSGGSYGSSGRRLVVALMMEVGVAVAALVVVGVAVHHRTGKGWY